MFKAVRTPALCQMAGPLFRQTNVAQQAGILTRILGSTEPGGLASLLGRASVPNLSGTPGELTGYGAQPTSLALEKASRLTPAQVQDQDTALHAAQSNPCITDRMRSFCAEHPPCAKTLGGPKRAIVLANVA